jgi:hypothetical protein
MEVVGPLTGGLAHDFQNLLAIIIGNLGLLSELGQNDPVTDELVPDALESELRGVGPDPTAAGIRSVATVATGTCRHQRDDRWHC